MLVYINRRPVEGPWGGGSKVVAAIARAIINAGHTVSFDDVDDADVLLCMDPRPAQGMRDWRQLHECRVLRPKHPKIVQRVGDLGTHGKPDLTALVQMTVPHSDFNVFPSTWAWNVTSDLISFVGKQPNDRWLIIPNAPMAVFRRVPRNEIGDPIRLVTHHWSTNPMKGFDFYTKLDNALGEGVEMTYIGRIPVGLRFNRIKHLPPMDEKGLAEELPKHDIYVTASRQEAGANHVLEAIACGLPVIYHVDGGSIPEYCVHYGTSFDGSLTSFQSALDAVKIGYPKFRKALRQRETLDDVAKKYVTVLEVAAGAK